MRRALLTSAAVIALSATGASAQVIGANTLDSIINNVMTTANANFAGIAVNTAAIDGRINIDSTGQGGATAAASAAADTSSTSSTANSLSVGGVSFENQGGAGGPVAVVDIQSTLLGGLVNCDVTTGGGSSAAGECNFGIESIDLAATTDTTATSAASNAINATQEATTQNFGAVAALAAGAVNSTTMDLTEVGGSVQTGSAASTSNTAASATFSELSGAGMTGIAYAGNEGAIFGSATILLSGGNIGFDSISTTALGAANTATITATVVGTVAP
jgi:hypothetical protein